MVTVPYTDMIIEVTPENPKFRIDIDYLDLRGFKVSVFSPEGKDPEVLDNNEWYVDNNRHIHISRKLTQPVLIHLSRQTEAFQSMDQNPHRTNVHALEKSLDRVTLLLQEERRKVVYVTEEAGLMVAEDCSADGSRTPRFLFSFKNNLGVDESSNIQSAFASVGTTRGSGDIAKRRDVTGKVDQWISIPISKDFVQTDEAFITLEIKDKSGLDYVISRTFKKENDRCVIGNVDLDHPLDLYVSVFDQIDPTLYENLEADEFLESLRNKYEYLYYFRDVKVMSFHERLLKNFNNEDAEKDLDNLFQQAVTSLPDEQTGTREGYLYTRSGAIVSSRFFVRFEVFTEETLCKVLEVRFRDSGWRGRGHYVTNLKEAETRLEERRPVTKEGDDGALSYVRCTDEICWPKKFRYVSGSLEQAGTISTSDLEPEDPPPCVTDPRVSASSGPTHHPHPDPTFAMQTFSNPLDEDSFSTVGLSNNTIFSQASIGNLSRGSNYYYGPIAPFRNSWWRLMMWSSLEDTVKAFSPVMEVTGVLRSTRQGAHPFEMGENYSKRFTGRLERCGTWLSITWDVRELLNVEFWGTVRISYFGQCQGDPSSGFGDWLLTSEDCSSFITHSCRTVHRIEGSSKPRVFTELTIPWADPLTTGHSGRSHYDEIEFNDTFGFHHTDREYPSHLFHLYFFRYNGRRILLNTAGSPDPQYVHPRATGLENMTNLNTQHYLMPVLAPLNVLVY